MNIGDIVKIHCDLEGQPVNYPENYSFTIKRNFKLIGKNSKKNLYLLELHYNSPFGIKGSIIDLDGFELCPNLDSTNLPLIKIFPVTEKAFVERKEYKTIGCNCIHCQENYPYAEINRKDGKFLCYSCRVSVGGRYPDLTQ